MLKQRSCKYLQFCVEDPADASNPYAVFGNDAVPKILYRCMATPERLSDQILKVMRWRKTDEKRLCEATGVEPNELRNLIEFGTGPLSTTLTVLDYLGIIPLELPSPDFME